MQKVMDKKYIEKYIAKYVRSVNNVDSNFYTIIKDKMSLYDESYLICNVCTVIKELECFGQITRKNLYALCQCVLYGIITNEIVFFSMNSNALVKNTNQLRSKPQYKQIRNIDNKLKEIESKINIPVKYLSVLPDYSDDYPLDEYDEMWNQNIKYLESVSGKKAYRLSKLYSQNITFLDAKVSSLVDCDKLNKIISYYENNCFIVLSFNASPDFQRKQIISYLKTGLMLEEILPFAILLDVQKRNYPFEQSFYNYARHYKLPIILCGQKY